MTEEAQGWAAAGRARFERRLRVVPPCDGVLEEQGEPERLSPGPPLDPASACCWPSGLLARSPRKSSCGCPGRASRRKAPMMGAVGDRLGFRWHFVQHVPDRRCAKRLAFSRCWARCHPSSQWEGPMTAPGQRASPRRSGRRTTSSACRLQAQLRHELDRRCLETALVLAPTSSCHRFSRTCLSAGPRERGARSPDTCGGAPSAQPLFIAYGQFGTPADDNVNGVVCLEDGATADNCVE